MTLNAHDGGQCPPYNWPWPPDAKHRKAPEDWKARRRWPDTGMDKRGNYFCAGPYRAHAVGIGAGIAIAVEKTGIKEDILKGG